MQNQPEKKFRAGAVSATIWKNTQMNDKKENFEYHTVSLDRAYKDKNDNWQRTNSFRLNDLPKCVLVMRKAYEYLAMSKQDSQGSSRELNVNEEDEIIM